MLLSFIPSLGIQIRNLCAFESLLYLGYPSIIIINFIYCHWNRLVFYSPAWLSH